MAIFGDFMSPDTARLLGLEQPDAGGPADQYKPYDLTPPSAMGGGGSLGALSNMLMSMGATSMMMDPTGRSQGAGVAMLPFISRKIQEQNLADESFKLTNIITQAEQAAQGDPRQMLNILANSDFKATTPVGQKLMLDTIKGLRDKVLKTQQQETDTAAQQRLLGQSSSPTEPAGPAEPANYVEQVPAMVQ